MEMDIGNKLGKIARCVKMTNTTEATALIEKGFWISIGFGVGSAIIFGTMLIVIFHL